METAFDVVQRQLLTHLREVHYEMPSDIGEFRLALSCAFMSGAAILAELGERGAGVPFIRYADTLKRRREGFREGLLSGGRILS
jgi:hypothetical protein